MNYSKEEENKSEAMLWVWHGGAEALLSVGPVRVNQPIYVRLILSHSKFGIFVIKEEEKKKHFFGKKNIWYADAAYSSPHFYFYRCVHDVKNQ